MLAGRATHCVRPHVVHARACLLNLTILLTKTKSSWSHRAFAANIVESSLPHSEAIQLHVVQPTMDQGMEPCQQCCRRCMLWWRCFAANEHYTVSEQSCRLQQLSKKYPVRFEFPYSSLTRADDRHCSSGFCLPAT